MRRLQPTKNGFTLIELMIVVAIIGILAAIAIPNFLRFQLRSRVGEGKTNIAAIRTAEEAYNAEYGTYVGALVPHPGGADASLTSDKQLWTAPAPGFDTIGWFPEGEVYYNYSVNSQPAGCPAAGLPCTLYTIEGRSDIDNDDANINRWGYLHTAPGATAGIASLSGDCVATGVYNPVSQAQDLLNTTGPCTMDDGQRFF